jgi:hypothetical protein
MFCNFRVDHLGAQGLQPAERPFLVGSDAPRISRHIGRKNCRKPTFDVSWPFGLHGASLLADNPTPTGARCALSKKGRALAPLCEVAEAAQVSRLARAR